MLEIKYSINGKNVYILYIGNTVILRKEHCNYGQDLFFSRRYRRDAGCL